MPMRSRPLFLVMFLPSPGSPAWTRSGASPETIPSRPSSRNRPAGTQPEGRTGLTPSGSRRRSVTRKDTATSSRQMRAFQSRLVIYKVCSPGDRMRDRSRGCWSTGNAKVPVITVRRPLFGTPVPAFRPPECRPDQVIVVRGRIAAAVGQPLMSR
jgi:hypothetical protein